MSIRLPKTRSTGWFRLISASFVVNFSLIIISRLFIDASISIQNIFGFVILSLIFSTLLFLGYYGLRVWVYCIVFSNLIGLLYMLYSVVFQTGAGWTDLISIFSLISLIAVGFIGGLIAQVVFWVTNMKENR